MELEHPERFLQLASSAPLAKWNGTISELLELVIALFLTGEIRRPTGQKMNLAEVAALFGKVFGMEVRDLYGRKSKLLMRKKSELPFLEKLTFLYREEVEKISL